MGLIQERRNYIASARQSCLSCTIHIHLCIYNIIVVLHIPVRKYRLIHKHYIASWNGREWYRKLHNNDSHNNDTKDAQLQLTGVGHSDLRS